MHTCQVAELLLGDSRVTFLLLLGLVKLLATACSTGAGLVGGLFAPTLFIGATFGAAFHGTATELVPWLVQAATSLEGAAHTGGHLGDFATANAVVLAGTPTYAVVGAAACLAALFRCPLAACLLLLELTRGDVGLLFPTLVAASVAELTSTGLERRLR